MKPGAKPARGGRGMRDPQAGRAQGWKERMIDEATRAGVRAGSALWSSVNAIARAVPKTKQDLGVPVISVGNLQAGGAGKTPVVIEIVRLLIAMGARPAVITRGYRSLAEREGGLLFTENGRVECEVTGCRVGGTETGAPGGDRARLFGDEATLIHERTGVPVFVSRARAENYRRHVSRLEASARPTVLVLDDGFQQFGLKKDLEVVCVTDLVPGEVVHREFASALRPEHYILSTKRRARVGGGIASVPAGRKPDGSLELRSDPSALGPDVRAGGAVLVTGIAAGARVKNELADAGIRILAWHEFPDHHHYSAADLESIESDAGPASSAPILTTEKDWMKLRTLVSDPARYRVVPLGLVWIDGETALKERLWRLLRES